MPRRPNTNDASTQRVPVQADAAVQRAPAGVDASTNDPQTQARSNIRTAADVELVPVSLVKRRRQDNIQAIIN